jgi:hypothetical protein
LQVVGFFNCGPSRIGNDLAINIHKRELSLGAFWGAASNTISKGCLSYVSAISVFMQEGLRLGSPKAGGSL